MRPRLAALGPEGSGSGVLIVLDGVHHLSRGDVANELRQGYRIAGAFESLGRHAFNMARRHGKAKRG